MSVWGCYWPFGPADADEEDLEEDLKVCQMQDMLTFLDKKEAYVMIGHATYGFDVSGRFIDPVGYTTFPGPKIIDALFDHLYRNTLRRLQRESIRSAIPHSKSLLLKLYENILDGVVDREDLDLPPEMF